MSTTDILSQTIAYWNGRNPSTFYQPRPPSDYSPLAVSLLRNRAESARRKTSFLFSVRFD